MKNSKPPLLSPVLKLFMVAMVLANIGSAMMFGYLSLYLMELGADIVNVGAVFTISSIVPLIFQIIGGWISDQIGRLKAVAWGSVAGVVSSFGYVFAPNWQSITISLGITYIAIALVSPSFSSFIADQTIEENRGKVYGVTDSIFNIIGVIGPLLGGYIALNYDYKTLYSVAAIFYSVAAILRIWMANSTKYNTEGESKKLDIKSFKKNMKSMFSLLIGGGLITWIFITDGVRDIGGQLSGSLYQIYEESVGGLSVLEIGYFASILSITMVIFTAPGGWFSDKYGERLGITIGFFLNAIGMFLFLPSRSLQNFAIAGIVFGISNSLIGPAYQSMISKAFPKNMRGTAFGFFRSSLGIISLPAPWIGAQLWESYTPQLPFILTTYTTIIAGFIVWFKLKLPKTNSEEI